MVALRQKLLYGRSCATELAVLKQEIVNVKDTCISRIRELVNSSVYLYLHCQKLLLKKKRLDEELAEIAIITDPKLGLVTGVEPRKRPCQNLYKKITHPKELVAHHYQT